MEDQDPGQDFSSHAPFSLGDVRVDPPPLRIERGGISQRVEAKVMQVLLALAREPGQVVSRRDLEAEVWPGRVVTDDAVTNTIGKLRKALRDNPRKPRFIETIAKSGYRLKVEPLPAAAEVAAQHSPPVGASRLRRLWIALAIGAALLAALVLLGVYNAWQTSADRLSRAPAAGKDASIAVIPFNVLGDDPAQAYFAEGITLDLITELSRFPELLVIAPGSVFGYRETSADDRDIAA
jgi:DNA-binding winged helix-turn-helix (wHTH) protein